MLRAAVLLFAEKGFGGVSIREIATAADRNSSSISFHFGGKEGIHQAAVGLACQQVRHMVDSFPLLPGEGESDSKLKSEVALRGAIRAILLSTLPAPSPSVEDGAFACALIVLFLREMAFPLPETEPHVLAAVRSHVNYMDRCIRFIRPDLDARSTLRAGMSIYGQLLFFLTYKSVLPSLSEEGFAETDLSSLIDQVTTFCLQGLRPA